MNLCSFEQVAPGGVVFFRESCFKQSGDKPRKDNPTHYRCAQDPCTLSALKVLPLFKQPVLPSVRLSCAQDLCHRLASHLPITALAQHLVRCGPRRWPPTKSTQTALCNIATACRNPREYFRMYDSAAAVEADGRHSHFELCFCKCIDTYVRVKRNQNQIWWVQPMLRARGWQAVRSVYEQRVTVVNAFPHG